MLSHLDAPVRFVSERQLENGAFANMKLIVVPAAAYVPAGTVEALNRFAEKGGVVAVMDGALRSDPYGDPLPLLKKGRRIEGAIDAAGFDRLLTECGISRPVRLRGVVPGQIELRSVRLSPEETLFYAINYGPAVEFRPELEGVPVESARELISGKDVRFPVELKNRQPVMFKVKK